MSLDAKTALFIALAIVAVLFLIVFARGVRQTRASGTPVTPDAPGLLTGFITNFFDTLGIGSFATTTAAYRHWRMVRDEHIPGTLNVGHCLPAIMQAFIYTRIVPIDSLTLILMIVAAVLGAWLGAGVVAQWPRSRIQLGMGLALLGAAGLMLAAQLQLVPAGGELLRLTGTRLVIGIVANFLLGALMTIGIGLYGPCMILVSLLGMNPTAAFPIMMGSCAFLMPIASARFIRERAFDARAALGLVVGGLPAVLIAAFIVKTMPLSAVRWLVVIVVTYTAVTLLLTARRERFGAVATDPHAVAP